MVEFWADHFNTNITSVGIFKTLEVREVYRRHALGTFAGMLSASASSPAMLTYLNNTQSDGRTGRVPNQNYAREIMELHTLGVDGGYTQDDVVNVARCFTGWRTYFNTGDFRSGTFYYDASRHDNNSKLVLGVPIAAGGGFNDGMNVINILSTHPSCARFVAKKLLRWLLNYDPSPALVADIAGEFTRTGGDIKALVRRILHYDNVLWAPPLFKRPFHYIVSALRVMNANITSLNTIRQTYLSGTGQPPVCVGSARWLPAGVRVLGRPAAPALELRVPAGEQQRQRRRGRPDGAARGRHQRDPDRRSHRRAALRRARCRSATRRRSSPICVRPGPRPCRRRRRFATRSAWRWPRRRFSGTDRQEFVASGRLIRGALPSCPGTLRTTTAMHATNTVSSRAASSCRAGRPRPSR